MRRTEGGPEGTPKHRQGNHHRDKEAKGGPTLAKSGKSLSEMTRMAWPKMLAWEKEDADKVLKAVLRHH